MSNVSYYVHPYNIPLLGWLEAGDSRLDGNVTIGGNSIGDRY